MKRHVNMQQKNKVTQSVFIIRLQCLSVLFLLALLEIGPIPIAPFFGMYLVLWRPPWFKTLVGRLYDS